jgi:hypothetical protein
MRVAVNQADHTFHSEDRANACAKKSVSKYSPSVHIKNDLQDSNGQQDGKHNLCAQSYHKLPNHRNGKRQHEKVYNDV